MGVSGKTTLRREYLSRFWKDEKASSYVMIWGQ